MLAGPGKNNRRSLSLPSRLETKPAVLQKLLQRRSRRQIPFTRKLLFFAVVVLSTCSVKTTIKERGMGDSRQDAPLLPSPPPPCHTEAVAGRVVKSKVTNGGGLKSCPTFCPHNGFLSVIQLGLQRQDRIIIRSFALALNVDCDASQPEDHQPVWATRAPTPRSLRRRFPSQRGSPVRPVGSLCWISLCRSRDSSSSSPLLLRRKLRVL